MEDLMADTPSVPPEPSWLAPAHAWVEPPLHIRQHHLERQQSATGPASDDDQGDRP
jgi:hypothetical protein